MVDDLIEASIGPLSIQDGKVFQYIFTTFSKQLWDIETPIYPCGSITGILMVPIAEDIYIMSLINHTNSIPVVYFFTAELIITQNRSRGIEGVTFSCNI